MDSVIAESSLSSDRVVADCVKARSARDRTATLAKLAGVHP